MSKKLHRDTSKPDCPPAVRHVISTRPPFPHTKPATETDAHLHAQRIHIARRNPDRMSSPVSHQTGVPPNRPCDGNALHVLSCVMCSKDRPEAYCATSRGKDSHELKKLWLDVKPGCPSDHYCIRPTHPCNGNPLHTFWRDVSMGTNWNAQPNLQPNKCVMFPHTRHSASKPGRHSRTRSLGRKTGAHPLAKRITLTKRNRTERRPRLPDRPLLQLPTRTRCAIEIGGAT